MSERIQADPSSIWGRPFIVSQYVPRDERAALDYRRSLLSRLLSGRMTDVRTEDGGPLCFELADGTLVIDPETRAALQRLSPEEPR